MAFASIADAGHLLDAVGAAGGGVAELADREVAVWRERERLDARHEEICRGMANDSGMPRSGSSPLPPAQ